MADTLDSVFDLPDVSFIDNDSIGDMMQRLITNFEAKYKEVTGVTKSLAPADPYRIALYAAALELYQTEQYVDRAGKQDLLKYSYGEFLDNLGGNRGVVRQQPAAATTTLRFTLSEAKGYAVGIPAGTRATNGGGVYFATTEYGEIPAGAMSVEIEARCTENGVTGNGLVAGQVNLIVDRVAYIESVTNTTGTIGGADLESDESLAERIFLAPSSYSVAGPDDAYVYWAKTYSAAIGSVKVTSPTPGVVVIYTMMADGSLPGEKLLQGLEEFLHDENIRPLTDQVTVKVPSVVPFDLDLTYYINRSDATRATMIQASVAAAVAEYVTWQTTEIGKDINPSELTRMVVAAGAKRVEIRSPTFTKIDAKSVAQAMSQTVTYGGLEDD